MRRTLFYLSVALLAFGIGSFVVFKFYRNDERRIEETVNKSDIEKTEPLSNFNQQNVQSEKQKRTFKCEDQFLLAVWNYLQKDKDLKEVFDRGIQNNHLSNCSEVIGIDKFVDLNNDGTGEAFVKGEG